MILESIKAIIRRLSRSANSSVWFIELYIIYPIQRGRAIEKKVRKEIQGFVKG